jgi:hypothetical protein
MTAKNVYALCMCANFLTFTFSTSVLQSCVTVRINCYYLCARALCNISYQIDWASIRASGVLL